ncbi:MAG: flagellar hook assembly protein FlgD [Thermodesulfobacteriota bacterium]
MTVSQINSSIPYLQKKSVQEPVGKSDLDRQDFMKLFITQMQYQDPMKPMESDDMAAQLAQFSNMEATQDMADNLQEMLDYQKSGNNLQLLNLIDKEVAISGSQIGIYDGNKGSGEFFLNDQAASCQVYIYDAAGNPVKTIDKGQLGRGLHEVDWDGEDAEKEEVASGMYQYEVKAYDALGNPLEVEPYTVGKVTGIDFNSEKPGLTIDKHVQTSADQVERVL